MAQKSITILGSTGSIGTSTLDIVEAHPERFKVHALTANKNVTLLAKQAKAFHPEHVVIADETKFGELKDLLQGTSIKVSAGDAAVVEAAAMPTDLVMAGIVGAAGLKPTLAAIRRGAIIALANKEVLVCAGQFMMDEVKRHGATLLPVDSEHNAIFQVFDFDAADQISRIILTASGGPFRTFSYEDMRNVTPAQAVAHPNWDMGAKISVDSATMMNKGLELIEAFHLYPLAENQIDILVHPQSVIHSMVEYVDGSVLGQMGSPDMRTPISYCMAWPERISAPVERLDFAKLGTFTFETPDEVRFPALKLSREALKQGGAAPAVLNAANEIAVAAFLDKKIGFLDITRVVDRVLSKDGLNSIASLDDVFETDRVARISAREIMKQL